MSEAKVQRGKERINQAAASDACSWQGKPGRRGAPESRNHLLLGPGCRNPGHTCWVFRTTLEQEVHTQMEDEQLSQGGAVSSSTAAGGLVSVVWSKYGMKVKVGEKNCYPAFRMK